MSDRALTKTSYVVLGLVRTLQPCTAYDMKQLVKVSIGMFWSFPHSQLYAEPTRLVLEGLLVEDQESGGRRRRTFRITPAGEEALEDWLTNHAEPSIGELRDDGLLKLFFSGGLEADDVAELARTRARVHRERIDFLTALRDEFDGRATPAQLATIELGIRWDETASAFWDEIEATPPLSHQDR